MATTIHEISGMLTQLKAEHAFTENNAIAASFATEKYLSPAGEKKVLLLFSSNEAGVEIKTLGAYSMKGKKENKAFFKLCSILQAFSFGLQFEYIAQHGFVEAVVEVPLGTTGKLTVEQLHLCVVSVVGCLESYHELLVAALETGELRLPDELKKKMEEHEQGASDDDSTTV